MAGARPSIEEVKDRHEAQLMSLEGVEGVAIGEDGGTLVIKVYVVKKTPALQAAIPGELEQYPVRVEASGEFRAL